MNLFTRLGFLASSLLVSVATTAVSPLVWGVDDVFRAVRGKTFTAAGLKNPLREDLQRPVDARLLKIEAEGIDDCGLFSGKVHVARSASEVRSLSGKLKPGDQLVLAGKDWKDARFSFGGTGTEDAPILIRPEKLGGVVFTGETQVAFHGSHLVVQGLEFRNVTVSKDSTIIVRIGNGQDNPADHCIVNDIKMENCGSTAPEDWPRTRAFYMSLSFGRDNTVANSTFSGMKNIGVMLYAAELPPEGLQRLHILNNRFSDRPKIDNQNGYEIIMIGWSGEKGRSAGSLIRGNTFENCDGENELITLKASDIFVCDNHFNASQGVLCLRTANRVLVQGNTFDGKGRRNTGGVRMQGADHVIVQNTFRDLKQPADYYSWPVSLMAASSENYGDNGDLGGYGRARNIFIAGNRFEQCDGRIAVGIFPRKAYPLLPKNIRVLDNVFTGATATSPFDFVAPDPTGRLAKELHESGNQFLP